MTAETETPKKYQRVLVPDQAVLAFCQSSGHSACQSRGYHTVVKRDSNGQDTRQNFFCPRAQKQFKKQNLGVKTDGTGRFYADVEVTPEMEAAAQATTTNPTVAAGVASLTGTLT